MEARLAQVSELASPGTPIVQLWDTSRLQLSVQVQTNDASLLAQARPEFVSQGREYAVKLLRVSPAVNPASRNREARFSFPQAAPAPGSNGVLRWRDPRPFVPADIWSSAQASSACSSSIPGARVSSPCPTRRKGGPPRLPPCQPRRRSSPTAASPYRTA